MAWLYTTSICQNLEIHQVLLLFLLFCGFCNMIDALSLEMQLDLKKWSVISRMKSSHVSIMSWSNKGVARRTGESFHQQMRKVYLVVVLLCSFSFARAACCPSAIFFKVQHQSRQDLPTWFSLYQKKGLAFKANKASNLTNHLLLAFGISILSSGLTWNQVENLALIFSLEPSLLHSKPSAKPR